MSNSTAPVIGIPAVSNAVWESWTFYCAFALFLGVHAIVFIRACVRWYAEGHMMNLVTALGGTFATLAFMAISATLLNTTYFITFLGADASTSQSLVAPVLFLALAAIYAGIEIDFVALSKFSWTSVVGGRVAASQRVQAYLETYSHRGPYGAAARPLFVFLFLFASCYADRLAIRVILSTVGITGYLCFIVYHALRTYYLLDQAEKKDIGFYRFVSIIVMHTLAQAAGIGAAIVGLLVTYNSDYNLDARSAFPSLIIVSLGLYALSMIVALTLPQTENGYFKNGTSKGNKLHRSTTSAYHGNGVA